MRRLLAALMMILAAGVAHAAPCATCSAVGGTYEATAPAGWDGRSRLRLLVFLHGFMMEGADIVADTSIRDAAAKMNFLLVAPDGLMRSWSHTGSPSQARDDVAFVRGVVADAKARWPIDPKSVVAAGFSQGASMVWDLACYAAADFTAFLPFSGGFWEPMPRTCASGAVELRHVHGRDDPVMPMGGRALFGPFRQGDIRRGFEIWLTEDGCRGKPLSLRDWAGLDCESWSNCGSGRRLQLCLRAGGHRMWQGDLLAGLRWAVGR